MLARNSIRILVFSLLTVVGMIISSVEAKAATFYRSTTATANFLSGTCWSASSCGVGGMSWPTATTDIVNIGCASKTTTIGSGGTCGDLNISNGTVNITGGTLYVWGNLNLSGGTLNVSGTANVVIYGNFNKTGGTFSHTAGTINMGGSGTQNINSNTSPLTFFNLAISGTGNRIMTNNLTVNNTLTLTNGYLSVGSYTLQVGTSTSGNDISESSGRITITSSSSLAFGGSVVATLSNILSNSAPWTINNFSMYRNLATITLGGNLTVNGAFNLCAGGASGSGDVIIGANTLTLNGAVTGAMSGSLVGSSSSDLTIGGSGTMSMYFDLSTTSAGGTNTIRNFNITRTGTFNLLSSIRIGNTLTLGTSTTYFKFSVSGSQSITFDGAGTAWAGPGYFQGNSTYSNNFYIYGSGAIPNPLKFANDFSISTLQIHRTNSGSSAVLQLGTNINISSSITLSNLANYGSIDINGKTISLGSATIFNETNSNRIFNSACPTVGLITSSNDLSASTTYTGITTTYGREMVFTYPAISVGYNGMGLEITTGSTAPGTTTINRGFCERSGGDLTSSVLRYFEISPTTNAGLNATMIFHYWDAEGNGLTEEDNSLYRDDTPTDGWVDKGGTSTPGSGDNTVSLSGIPQFSSWTAGKKTIIAPINLLFFSAECNSKFVQIDWSTASEINNEYFTIEKTVDFKNWIAVDKISGAGNSNQVVKYSYSDINPLAGTVYYRLKQTDFDGNYKYFAPVVVNCEERFHNSGISIYPNPAEDFISILSQIPLTAKLSLFDITGRIINEYQTDDLSETYKIPLTELKSGVYFLKSDCEGNTEMFRIVKK